MNNDEMNELPDWVKELAPHLPLSWRYEPGGRKIQAGGESLAVQEAVCWYFDPSNELGLRTMKILPDGRWVIAGKVENPFEALMALRNIMSTEPAADGDECD